VRSPPSAQSLVSRFDALPDGLHEASWSAVTGRQPSCARPRGSCSVVLVWSVGCNRRQPSRSSSRAWSHIGPWPRMNPVCTSRMLSSSRVCVVRQQHPQPSDGVTQRQPAARGLCRSPSAPHENRTGRWSSQKRRPLSCRGRSRSDRAGGLASIRRRGCGDVELNRTRQSCCRLLVQPQHGRFVIRRRHPHTPSVSPDHRRRVPTGS